MMPIVEIPQVRIIDAIIGALVLEIVALAVYRLVRGTGLASGELIAFLGAGLSMLIGLRIVADGGSFAAFAAVMLISLMLHLWHVTQRWQR